MACGAHLYVELFPGVYNKYLTPQLHNYRCPKQQIYTYRTCHNYTFADETVTPTVYGLPIDTPTDLYL